MKRTNSTYPWKKSTMSSFYPGLEGKARGVQLVDAQKVIHTGPLSPCSHTEVVTVLEL